MINNKQKVFISDYEYLKSILGNRGSAYYNSKGKPYKIDYIYGKNKLQILYYNFILYIKFFKRKPVNKNNKYIFLGNTIFKITTKKRRKLDKMQTEKVKDTNIRRLHK